MQSGDNFMKDWAIQSKLNYARAIFLDRDGTINIDTHYPHKIEELEFLPGVVKGFKILSLLAFHIIVVSNQGGIGLSIFTRKEMSKFNREIRLRINKIGGRIDAFYYCPHHRKKNSNSTEIYCNFYKPNPGMLFEAARDFKIDLLNSFMIGDKPRDIEAGKRAGCKTILINNEEYERNNKMSTIQPDFYKNNLYEAVLLIKTFENER